MAPLGSLMTPGSSKNSLGAKRMGVYHPADSVLGVPRKATSWVIETYGGTLGRFLEAYSVRRVRAAIRARSITENQSCERGDFSTAEADRPFWQRLLFLLERNLLERNEDFRPGVPFFCVSDGTGRFSQRIASVDHRG